MKRIAVVGGGLSGLTVAYRLGLAGHDIAVFEASGRLGGQLSTAREDGWIVELGAEGFVARSEAVPRLAADLGMSDGWGKLLDQSATTSYRFDGHELRALAPGEAAEALSFQVAPSARGAGIRTFVGGMQSLTDALAIAARARSTIHLEQPIAALELGGLGPRIGGVTYDAVVLATSSAAAARLLVPLLGETELARAETLSSVTVSLGYDAHQVRHNLGGTGFVVGEPFEGFRACTFTTSKFAHRAPEGCVSLRTFFRPTPEELLADTPWEARAAAVLGRVLPIDGAPRRAWVSRWPRALPVFSPEHRQLVARVEETLGTHGIHLAGSAFHGSGIDAAVLSAEAVTARIQEA
jgi:oxygen-dependent protoporphyrinogen oxidase